MDIEVLENLFKESRPLEGNIQGIYFLFDDEELVYIGKGQNCFIRIAEHTLKKSNKKFTSWNFIPVEEIEELNHFEKYLIQKFKPKYNVQHKNSRL